MSFMTISLPKMIQCGPCKHVKTNEIGHVIYTLGPTQKRGIRMLVKYASGKTKWLGYTGFYSRWEMLPPEEDVPKPANLPSTGIVFTDKQKEALAFLVEHACAFTPGSVVRSRVPLNMLRALHKKITGQPVSTASKTKHSSNTAIVLSSVINTSTSRDGEQHV